MSKPASSVSESTMGTRNPLEPGGSSGVGTPRVGFPSLAEALQRETKLLNDLQAVLQQQREAVAAEDLPGVDDTIFAA